MRRIVVLAISWGLLAQVAYATCDSSTPPTFTTNVGLSKPVINACNWGTTTNADWDIADSSFAAKAIANMFTSTQTFAQPIVIQPVKPLRFSDNSTHFVQLQASQTVTNTTWVLPNADGTSGQVIKTDGAGNLSFTTAGGGSSALGVSQSSVSISSPTVALNFIGPPFSVTLAGGNTAQINLNVSSVTLQGNTFNGASQLVKLDASSKLPICDGSNLTNVGGANYIFNQNSLQTGATAYPDFLHVNTSATFSGVISISSAVYASNGFGNPNNVLVSLTTSTVWTNGVRAGAYQLIGVSTASASASLTFSNLNTIYASEFILEFANVTTGSNNTKLQMQISENGSLQTTNIYDNSSFIMNTGGTSNEVCYSETEWTLSRITSCGTTTGDMGTGANQIGGGTAIIHGAQLGNTGLRWVTTHMTYINSGGNLEQVISSGELRAAGSNIDAIKLFMSSGNIAAGTFYLYALIGLPNGF